MRNPASTHPTSTQSPLPQPFTLEQLHSDILGIYLLQLRATNLFANDHKVWTLAGKVGIDDGLIWDGSLAPEDYGIAYSDIEDTTFALVLEQQYSFAFMGLDNLLCEPMEMDTMHTWVAAYLTDLKSSVFEAEWGANGANVVLDRCLHTCALANARNVLEGGPNFYPYMSEKDNEANKTEDALSVHQMALLSGMEEMSIRTAISRKSANQLKSFKEDRRTLIAIDDAKAWLKAKGRYVPVTRQSHAGANLSLEKTSFSSAFAIGHALMRRRIYIGGLDSGVDIQERLDELTERMGLDKFDIASRDALLNAPLMRELAVILQLPPDLLVLRAREAVLQEDVAKTVAAVQEAVEKFKKVDR